MIFWFKLFFATAWGSGRCRSGLERSNSYGYMVTLPPADYNDSLTTDEIIKNTEEIPQKYNEV
jgi:hypothetical protein